MPETKQEVELQFRNRRLVIDGLQIVPTWIWSAAVWYLFTKLVLDRLSPNKPGTEINLAIIGGDLLPDWVGGELIDLPPGVKVGALIDVIMAGIDILPDFPDITAKEFLDPFDSPIEKVAVNFVTDAVKVVVVTIGMITGAFRK